jgi:hypothetical protein
MRSHHDRRDFLRLASAGAVAGLGDLAFLSKLRPVTADETKLDPNLVRLASDMEPLVRLVEETPREKLLEEIGGRIKKGLSYREVLAALLLAGVRDVAPRPSVGFKIHAVLAVNAVHQASMNSPEEHRWMPLFWGLDNFKSAQAQNLKETGWRMGPVKEEHVPSASKARETFAKAMDNWDEEAADVAAAGLARHVGSNECFELFTHYCCRDFRDIGHKVIYVAGAFRVLQTIGWEHAEPVLRSLAYALLHHEGDNPAKRDGDADRPYRRNQKFLTTFKKSWSDGKPDAEATKSLLATLRTGTDGDAAGQVADMLNRGVSPQSIWDALHLGGGELLMRQPGIVGLHTLTTGNAFRYCYETTASDETRKILMLQLASFLPLFRAAMKGRGDVADVQIDKLEPVIRKGEPVSVDEVFADVGKDRAAGAAKALAYVQGTHEPKKLIDAARVLIFMKGTDSHDYKFSSAVLEDYANVSPAFRDRFLAASTYWLKGSSARDSGLVKRTRAALA